MTMTDNDEAGKLFVGGLSWETTKETLQTYFSKFGEVVDSVVMKNNETGRSRGFGFVTFKDPSCVSIVLQTKPHELNGRTVDAKECTPRSMQKNKKGPNPGKVFLGGLPPDITETDIRSAMARYGKVTQVSIMCDQETKKCRGFGFLSFDSEDSIDKACAERFVIINGKQVECKRAEPRDNSRRNQQFGGSSPNGGPPGSYGGGPGYQGGNWNQPFGMQGGNAYGNYQPYGAPAATPYGQSPVPYNAAPNPQYQQQQQPYGNYGGMGYGYPQAAAPAGNNWNAAPTPGAAAGYGQQPAAPNYSSPGYPQASGMSNEDKPGASGSYGASNAYQGNSSYGPSKSYGGGGGYQKQNNGNGAGRGQGYHPYRR
nr:heterogeneous nuclear ribonucleoprotein 27C isoform X2 [Parasteatoda tepidariorum]